MKNKVCVLFPGLDPDPDPKETLLKNEVGRLIYLMGKIWVVKAFWGVFVLKYLTNGTRYFP